MPQSVQIWTSALPTVAFAFFAACGFDRVGAGEYGGGSTPLDAARDGDTLGDAAGAQDGSQDGSGAPDASADALGDAQADADASVCKPLSATCGLPAECCSGMCQDNSGILECQ